MLNKYRLLLLTMLDSLIVVSSVYFSHWLIESERFVVNSSVMLTSSLILLCTYLLSSYFCNIYKKVWEYASVSELISIFKATLFSILVTALIQFIMNSGTVYYRILFISFLLLLTLIGGSRFVWRMSRSYLASNTENKKRTLIIGAGAAGTMIVRQLLQNKDSHLQPIAFIDDDIQKQNREIYGIPVVGASTNMNKLIEERNIEHILIAIPSLNKKELTDIYEQCVKTTAQIQIVPMLEDILEGKVSVNEFRDVQVEDLLGRESIKLDDEGITEKLQGRTILVTGAGGSIGSEICRQVLKYKPSKLVLLGHGENSIYTIEMELREKYKNSDVTIVTEIADVQDREAIFEVVRNHSPHIIYHAAAHKHVPLMERSPGESVKNNVFGTRNVAEAADTFGVGTFVMISTDKAVNPTNVMGTTKRMAEMVIQGLDKISTTRFVAVRFGNVLGSRGSVIPRFKEQIAKGGPVTVTHPEMTRFFMTIPEASRLVIQAGSFAKGGEIFVLDMGEAVKIVDLATNLIILSGYSLDEIKIEYSGLRPGEKMYEELLMDDENLGETSHKKIFIGQPVAENYTSLNMKLESLEPYFYDGKVLRNKLAEIVPTYKMAEHDKKNLVESK